jgi:Ser-tRNA(Ala) deacylase AlaX
MTEMLYMDDSYLKEFDAEIIEVKDEKFIVLNRTAFYLTGGGQQNDTGILKRKNMDGTEDEFKVLNVTKSEGGALHEVERAGLASGDKIHGVLDWERRYAYMRTHTAAHALSTIIHRETGALISGNQLYELKFRVDFDLENFDKNLFLSVIDIANSELKKARNVKHYYLSREEAMKIPGIVKLAGALPPSVDTLRIVEIEGLDIQADGGTHVKNTSEIGTLEFDSAENKGKGRKRVTIRIV